MEHCLHDRADDIFNAIANETHILTNPREKKQVF